jgi:hypothetical protein
LALRRRKPKPSERVRVAVKVSNSTGVGYEPAPDQLDQPVQIGTTEAVFEPLGMAIGGQLTRSGTITVGDPVRAR